MKNNFDCYKEYQKECTEKARINMINNGMQQLSKSEYLQIIDSLNYTINADYTLNYYNNSNEYHYLAKSIQVTDKASGLNFGYYNESSVNSVNHAKYQELRRNSFVYNNGKIWEL